MTWVTGAFYMDACFWIPFFFFIAFAGYLLYNKNKSDEKGGQNYAGFIRKRHRIIGKVQKVPEAQLGSLCSGGNGICICRKYSVDDYYCGAGYLPGNKVV